MFPEVVVVDKDGNYGMAYQNLTAPMMEAVSTEGTVSREEFEALQAKNDRLEKLVEQLIHRERQGGGQQADGADVRQC